MEKNNLLRDKMKILRELFVKKEKEEKEEKKEKEKEEENEEKEEENEANEEKEEKKKEKEMNLNILNLLIELFNKEKYNYEDYEKLVRFLTENRKPLIELRDFFKESSKGLIKIEQNNENNEKEKKESAEKNKNDYKKEEKNLSKGNNKKSINLNEDEAKLFFKLLSLMEQFPNKMNDSKSHFILVDFTKKWIDGFLGKTFRKMNNINNKPYRHQKQVIDPITKTHNIYESILKLIKPRDRNKLFSKLKDISLEYLKEEEKSELINICFNIYNDFTDSQKEIIKEKYSTLINEEEISEIIFLNFENIFNNEKYVSESLSRYIEDYQQIIKEKIERKKNNKSTNKDDNKKQIQINIKNVGEILLKIYKEFIHNKYKKDTYISLNNNYIEYKIYFFLIINFITYKEAFITGNILQKFLYIKYLYEYYNYNKFIKEIENIKNEITIYSEKDLKEEEKKEKNLEDDEIEEDKNEEESIAYKIDTALKQNLLKFINEKYFVLFSEVIKNINYFYRIPYPINALVNNVNIQFTFNILDLILTQEKYFRNIELEEKLNKDIKNQLLKKYRINLIKLETNIFTYYKESTSDYVNCNNGEELSGYKINKNMKKVYCSLVNEINKGMRVYNNYIIEYIPFGSITQFLSGKNGDIDLFLNLTRISYDNINNKSLIEEKTEILVKLRDILKKLDQYKEMTFHQTNRLCLFTITYMDVKIDINVYGICSYYGELLLREYSLIDFRFPMLVVYLKHIISKKNIKNSEEEKIYINSFAWTNILLTFLQDILYPPLFPKLLNEKNRKIITIKVGGGNGKEKRKVLEDEIKCQNTRKFNAFEENSMEAIKSNYYKGNKGLYRKNKMTVSEILLKFIEFIGYYFNYKYTIVNTSYECQSFMPKIQKNQLKDGFTKEFFKKCEKEEDILLIREPFDHTYNPCKTVCKDKLEKIKEVFRNIYVNILENGEI